MDNKLNEEVLFNYGSQINQSLNIIQTDINQNSAKLIKKMIQRLVLNFGKFSEDEKLRNLSTAIIVSTVNSLKSSFILLGDIFFRECLVYKSTSVGYVDGQYKRIEIDNIIGNKKNIVLELYNIILNLGLLEYYINDFDFITPKKYAHFASWTKNGELLKPTYKYNLTEWGWKKMFTSSQKLFQEYHISKTIEHQYKTIIRNRNILEHPYFYYENNQIFTIDYMINSYTEIKLTPLVSNFNIINKDEFINVYENLDEILKFIYYWVDVLYNHYPIHNDDFGMEEKNNPD